MVTMERLRTRLNVVLAGMAGYGALLVVLVSFLLTQGSAQGEDITQAITRAIAQAEVIQQMQADIREIRSVLASQRVAPE
jgi:hypothetical protein